MLFDETTLRKLEQLALVAAQVRAGVMRGERRSRRRGASVEFADYREYTHGDDLRRLDWNVYARLERPFIKLLEAEDDLAVHILLDASGSMDWPPEAGEEHKFAYARRLAGALGYIALASGDALHAALLGRDERRWGPVRGAGNGVRLFDFLESATAGGRTDLNVSLRAYALRARRPGLALLIGDLLAPGGFQDGLHALQARGHEVGVLHLLSPDEVDPPLLGDLKLIDAETDAAAEITLDAAALDAYRDRLRRWQGEIAAHCRARAVHYIPVVTDQPWERLVLRTLREQGVAR